MQNPNDDKQKTLSIDYNKRLNCFDTQLNETTNQIKIPMTNKKTLL